LFWRVRPRNVRTLLNFCCLIEDRWKKKSESVCASNNSKTAEWIFRKCHNYETSMKCDETIQFCLKSDKYNKHLT